ncbi:O-Glycosyl hydrolase [Sedimentisphaera cyanobacteriorum]|uniref:galactosylceramidase n=1 Tax=Sedimentisphaera cyanobacteriorum TaxID=1940790 RepID=A0A1Q2HMT3_9BACT|nr:discoidin domain-containing protein [Sedimentisphaera cyanobacteriorum]AQQ08601.1 O-Glycosyl hydrolase [Sedimentisphaera cyanobacteriorum]
MKYYKINKVSGVFLCISVLLLTACCGTASASTQINVDSSDTGRRYDGIGVVSAGGNARLLPDYEEPYKSDILDLLFKPKFGASLQVFKAEMGGSTSSTSGAEPTHAITREELDSPVSRGYEFWMMREAKDRNSEIMLGCLPWAYPYWVNGEECISCFCCPTQDAADYYVSFLDLAADEWGLSFDFIGAPQNEKNMEYPQDLDWIANTLKPTLVEAGYDLPIIAPDGGYHALDVFDHLGDDPAYDEVIEYVGVHRPIQKDRMPTQSMINSGKTLWDSEDSAGTGYWSGAKGIVQRMNQMYIDGRITQMLIWPPVDAAYEGVHCSNTGLIKTQTPWSGYYRVSPSVWAVAHYTQFTELGWKYMNNACGKLSGDGNFAALKSPDSQDFSVVVYSDNSEQLDFDLSGFTDDKVSVWRTQKNRSFIRMNDIPVSSGSFSLSCEPDSIYTISTTSGQTKGSPSNSIPEYEDFPFPYSENFEKYAEGETPDYLADMQGTFETAPSKGGRSGISLQQILPAMGDYTWIYTGEEPNTAMTLFGEMQWSNYEFSSDVFIEQGFVYVAARKGETQKHAGYALVLYKNGKWKLSFDNALEKDSVLVSGTVSGFDGDIWHNLKIRVAENKLAGYLDGRRLFTIEDASRDKGQPCLGSSFDMNQFDNLQIKNTGRWKVVDNTSQDISWDGWYTYSTEEFIGGNSHYTRGGDDSSTFTFNGRAARIYGSLRNDAGIFEVYIGEEKDAEIDCFSEQRQHSSLLYETPYMPSGNHTVSISTTGEKNSQSSGNAVVIDAFAYTDKLPCNENELPNLSLSSSASASSEWNSDYSASKACDENTETRWNSSMEDEVNGSWLALSFPQPVVISSVKLSEFQDRVLSHKIQYYQGGWKDLSQAGNIGDLKVHLFDPVRTLKVRLLITEAQTVPSIYEFEVFPPLSDFNRDGKVNRMDVYNLSQNWLINSCNNDCECGFCDILHDSNVDFLDFSAFSSDFRI